MGGHTEKPPTHKHKHTHAHTNSLFDVCASHFLCSERWDSWKKKASQERACTRALLRRCPEGVPGDSLLKSETASHIDVYQIFQRQTTNSKFTRTLCMGLLCKMVHMQHGIGRPAL